MGRLTRLHAQFFQHPDQVGVCRQVIYLKAEVDGPLGSRICVKTLTQAVGMGAAGTARSTCAPQKKSQMGAKCLD